APLRYHSTILLLPALYFSPSYSFFNHPPTTEIYTLSLHDALPIYRADRTAGAMDRGRRRGPHAPRLARVRHRAHEIRRRRGLVRSEEHTSELQSLTNIVCRLLLEKKKKTAYTPQPGHSDTPACRDC